MNNTIITCDSTCDLTKEQMEEFGIVSVPLYVRVDGGEYRDGVNIDAEMLFHLVDKCNTPPKTAAVSAQDYLDLWKPLLARGARIVHVNLSSEMSVCHQNARLAAAEVENVYVVDSRNLSTGSGLLAIEGALMAREGKGAREIADALAEKQKRLNVSFVLDTMEYLAKGGRCSGVAAFAAGLLKLRLCIDVKDGKMDVSKKYRGKMAAVLCDYARERLEAAGEVETERIFVTYSPGLPEDAVRAVEDCVREAKPFARVMRSVAGCTICSHCGPACLGILFFTK